MGRLKTGFDIKNLTYNKLKELKEAISGSQTLA